MKINKYCLLLLSLLLVSCGDMLGTSPETHSLDTKIIRLAGKAGAGTINTSEHSMPIKRLGQKLFFDKILSGNKDVSCATCHHPITHTSDNLSLSIGVGGTGLGADRQMGEGRNRIPRNAPDVFNRGVSQWHSMFWDSRVSGTKQSGFKSPAGNQLPEGLNSVLAVQAMFPVTARDEMRGAEGDVDVNGEVNELAQIEAGNFKEIWSGIMDRLLAIPQYVRLFKKAYPNVPIEELQYKHAANAIAAFEADAYTFPNTPWDRYIAGNKHALSQKAKKGAILFYGKAQCGSCHSGTLMTDQAHHNIGVPQLGPGKGDAKPLDQGFFALSQSSPDEFCFRTPPLRNVTLTSPWMHNGAYLNLRDAVKHHLDPEYALYHYNAGQLEESLISTYQEDANPDVLDKLDPLLSRPIKLDKKQMDQLMAFLKSLTDPAAKDLRNTIPESVPSGLSLNHGN